MYKPTLFANEFRDVKIISLYFNRKKEQNSLGPVVQSIASLMKSLRGQLVKCFMIL